MAWRTRNTDDRVVITNKDIYREVMRLAARVETVDTRNQTADKIDVDHEARIRVLERWRYGLPASIVLGLGSAGLALASVLHH